MKKPKIRQSNELFYIQGNEDTESCADYSNITLLKLWDEGRSKQSDLDLIPVPPLT